MAQNGKHSEMFVNVGEIAGVVGVLIGEHERYRNDVKRGGSPRQGRG